MYVWYREEWARPSLVGMSLAACGGVLPARMRAPGHSLTASGYTHYTLRMRVHDPASISPELSWY